ncbi:MAG: condensation domain-containing protein, partial [Atopobiaceae bacterium]|nr:condensation domain-containing protein [Atopobiaceae bacterium]
FVSDIGARPEISYGNVATLFHLPADEDLERLKSMLIQVIDNHPYLKVRYRESPDEHSEPTEWYVAMRDDAIPAEVFLIHAQKLPRSEMVQPYNLLGDENLYRVVLYDTEEEGKYLYLDFHHILVDEASCLIMFDDLKTYGGEGTHT